MNFFLFFFYYILLVDKCYLFHYFFSWHEIGYYDLPALIDYILEITHQSSLHYIGYSQGTTSFYVMCSERPEYNDKIKSQVSMAPIAFLSNQQNPLIKLIVKFYTLLEVL